MREELQAAAGLDAVDEGLGLLTPWLLAYILCAGNVKLRASLKALTIAIAMLKLLEVANLHDTIHDRVSMNFLGEYYHDRVSMTEDHDRVSMTEIS